MALLLTIVAITIASFTLGFSIADIRAEIAHRAARARILAAQPILVNLERTQRRTSNATADDHEAIARPIVPYLSALAGLRSGGAPASL